MKTAIALQGRALDALVKAEEQENERIAFWDLVPLPARMVAMMAARLPRERANEPLTEFTARERRQIAHALSALTSHLGVITRCVTDSQPQPAFLLH